MKKLIIRAMPEEQIITCVVCGLEIPQGGTGIQELTVGTPVFPTGICGSCCRSIAEAVDAYCAPDGEAGPDPLPTRPGASVRSVITPVRPQCGKLVGAERCTAELGHVHGCMTTSDRRMLAALTAIDGEAYWTHIRQQPERAAALVARAERDCAAELESCRIAIEAGDIPNPESEDWQTYYLAARVSLLGVDFGGPMAAADDDQEHDQEQREAVDA